MGLNPSKCDLIAHQDLSVKDDCLLSFVRVNVSDATLLGAPLFPGPVLDKPGLTAVPIWPEPSTGLMP